VVKTELQHQVEIITVSTSFVSGSNQNNPDEKYLFKRKLKQANAILDSSYLAAEASRIEKWLRLVGQFFNGVRNVPVPLG
jgi:hypothetical protein